MKNENDNEYPYTVAYLLHYLADKIENGKITGKEKIYVASLESGKIKTWPIETTMCHKGCCFVMSADYLTSEHLTRR